MSRERDGEFKNAAQELREFQEFLSEFNRRPDPEKLAELRWYLSEDDEDSLQHVTEGQRTPPQSINLK